MLDRTYIVSTLVVVRLKGKKHDDAILLGWRAENRKTGAKSVYLQYLKAQQQPDFHYCQSVAVAVPWLQFSGYHVHPRSRIGHFSDETLTQCSVSTKTVKQNTKQADMSKTWKMLLPAEHYWIPTSMRAKNIKKTTFPLFHGTKYEPSISLTTTEEWGSRQ